MAVRRKNSDPKWIVLSNDPALMAEDENAIHKYMQDRNLNHFNLDMDKGILMSSGETVTMVKVKPLSASMFHLVEYGVESFKTIVKKHIVQVKNFDGVEVVVKDGEPEVPDYCFENIDLDTLSELAAVIVELGKGKDGEDRAFFWADTLRQQRLRSRQLPANRARLESASTTVRKASGSEEETK